MPKPKPRQPLWRGPDVDGITQSLLGKFLECRERFRLRVVEGLSEDEGFSRPLEFGNFWHAAEEARLGGGDWEAALKKYRLTLQRTYPDAEAEIFKWYSVAKVTFPVYLAYWDRHKDESGAKPILEECSFAVPYHLPSGRMVLLRGKWDALRLLKIGKTAKSKDYGIYIKEHKTKGEIDEEGILKTVAWNLQTMMYQIALREALKDLPKEPDQNHPLAKMFAKRGGDLSLYEAGKHYKPAGVLYNVVRRPLADFHAIKQKVKESPDAFYRRLVQDPDDPKKGIKPNAKDYFMRWKVEVTDEDIQLFKDHTLHPILEQLWDWWEWIRVDPFNPWRKRKLGEFTSWQDSMKEPTITGTPFQQHLQKQVKDAFDEGDVPCPHYQSPWGVYNSLAGGFRGSYFQYLTTGRDYNLSSITNLFPELA